MRKRTMREWADFTGCLVAKNNDGSVFFFDCEHPSAMLVVNGMWRDVTYIRPLFHIKRKTCDKFITDIKDHDFRVPVYPRAV